MSEREPIEQALKQCEEEFRDLFRGSPLTLTLTSARDHRYIAVNDTFEQITGWKRSEVIGRTPFDVATCLDPARRVEFLERFVAGNAPRNFEVHALTKNGQVVTGLGSAALVEIEGETCVLSLVADVTRIKRFEEAKRVVEQQLTEFEAELSAMRRRLVQVQDRERQETTRELRSYLDRLLLVTIDLERLQQKRPGTAESAEIVKARHEVEELVRDVQSLSQRLHSSKLEYLGLVAASAALCRDFREKKKLEIEFASEGFTREPSWEVSLSIFLVLQEALENAATYSGSKNLQVLLDNGSDELRLTVRDFGRGFDPESALTGAGLGLAVSRERLRLQGGDLVIQSEPGQGTIIHAHVPISGSQSLAAH
ncbi:MAG TPA: ATP-binding protein [Candidatus Angelobacter sp.]